MIHKSNNIIIKEYTLITREKGRMKRYPPPAGDIAFAKVSAKKDIPSSEDHNNC